MDKMIWYRFNDCFILCAQTLRKGASNTEKEEFLKEALLMANFAHTHILRLLGVCLSKDPQFIILELMEGGDLLSYLRSCRPTQVSQQNCIASSPDVKLEYCWQVTPL